MGAVYAVAHGENIGAVDNLQKLGKGSGLIGLALVFYGIILTLVPAARPKASAEGADNRPPLKKHLISLVVSALAAFASSLVANNTHVLAERKEELSTEVTALGRQVTDLNRALDELKNRRQDLLVFLKEVSKRENIGFIHDSVSVSSWKRVIVEIEQLAPGQRQTIVMETILLAWHQLPFKLNGDILPHGVNSPAFITHVLSLNGLNIEKQRGESDSAALRRSTDALSDSPQPGDLMFFEGREPGSTGQYVMMYLGQGDEKTDKICLGVMGVKYPLGIYDATWLTSSPPPDRFIEFRRPRYLTRM